MFMFHFEAVNPTTLSKVNPFARYTFRIAIFAAGTDILNNSFASDIYSS